MTTFNLEAFFFFLKSDLFDWKYGKKRANNVVNQIMSFMTTVYLSSRTRKNSIIPKNPVKSFENKEKALRLFGFHSLFHLHVDVSYADPSFSIDCYWFVIWTLKREIELSQKPKAHARMWRKKSYRQAIQKATVKGFDERTEKKSSSFSPLENWNKWKKKPFAMR